MSATRSRTRPGGTEYRSDDDKFNHQSRKPAWFKVPAPGSDRYRGVKKLVQSSGLHTVCEEANCPNIGECWNAGTATFLILGDTCTRRCGFCNVKTGTPNQLDRLEPVRVAIATERLGLSHCVVTSVDRDDLADGGALHFADTIKAIRRKVPACTIEVLTPDFRGQEMPLARVLEAGPDVFNHNVETVPSLYKMARRGSDFRRSCRVLENAKLIRPQVITKSGLMVGLGENMGQMIETLKHLRENRVQVLTVGQYLRPTKDHLPIERYWHPDEFAELEATAYELGFESVAAGPLVRSSYRAERNLPDRARNESS